MSHEKGPLPDLEFAPLTPGRWSDFEELFGERGAIGGCWCMWWRLKRTEFERLKGEGNKQARSLTRKPLAARTECAYRSPEG